MLHILLELLDYSQMRRARREVLTELETAVHDCLKRVESASTAEQNGCYLLSFEKSGSASPSGIINTAFELHAIVSAYQEEISGFNILIDEHPGMHESEVLPSFRRSVIAADEENAIWMGEKSVSVLSPYVLYSKGTLLFRILEQKEKVPVFHGDLERFCLRPEIMKNLRAAVASRSMGTGQPGSILVRSNPLNLPHLTVSLALETKPGQRGNLLSFHGSATDHDALAALLQNLPADTFPSPCRFFSPEEQRLWETVKSILDTPADRSGGNSLNDARYRDGIIFLRLYLAAFCRMMKERGEVPVLICTQLEKFTEETLSLFREAAREAVEKKDLVFICISDSERFPDPFPDLPNEVLKIEPLSRSEIRTRLDEFLKTGTEAMVEAALARTKGLLLPLYHLTKVLERHSGKPGADSLPLKQSDIAWEFLESIAMKDLLYAVRLGRGILTADLIEGFLPFMNPGIPLSITVQSLEAMGFIRDSVSMEEYFPEVTVRIGSRLRDREPEIWKRFAEYAYSLWNTGRLRSTRNLFSIMIRYGTPDQAILVLESLLRNRLDRVLPLNLHHVLPLCSQLEQRLNTAQKIQLEDILLSVQLREATLNLQNEKAQKLLEQRDAAEHRDEFGRVLVEEARYLSARGEYRRALNAAKQALMQFQDTDRRIGEADAGIELALVMLAEERLVEAKEYFAIVRHSSEKSPAIYQLIRSITCEAVAFFVYGNYSRALQDALTACVLAEKHGMRRYQLYLTLIVGRTLFELGMYGESEQRFVQGRSLARMYSLEEPENVFSAWIARTLLYRNDPEECLRQLGALPETRETLFFIAEAHLESARPREAVVFADKALSTPDMVPALNPGERINWNSGFASVENMVFRKADRNDVLIRQIRALKGFIQGKDKDTYSIALSELYALTRNEKLSEHDPYNYLYYYFYADILPKERDRSIDDRLTVLGKAVKYLQERMSRIEDVDSKASYLTKNIWNNRLFQESKRNNLV